MSERPWLAPLGRPSSAALWGGAILAALLGAAFLAGCGGVVWRLAQPGAPDETEYLTLVGLLVVALPILGLSSAMALVGLSAQRSVPVMREDGLVAGLPGPDDRVRLSLARATRQVRLDAAQALGESAAGLHQGVVFAWSDDVLEAAIAQGLFSGDPEAFWQQASEVRFAEVPGREPSFDAAQVPPLQGAGPWRIPTGVGLAAALPGLLVLCWLLCGVRFGGEWAWLCGAGSVATLPVLARLSWPGDRLWVEDGCVVRQRTALGFPLERAKRFPCASASLVVRLFAGRVSLLAEGRTVSSALLLRGRGASLRRWVALTKTLRARLPHGRALGL